MRRDIPVKTMLIPTRVPMAHAELSGQVFQIIMARMRVTMALIQSQMVP